MDDEGKLLKASEDGDLDTVKKLIAKGTDHRRLRLNPRCGIKDTPLHAACW